MDKWMNNNNFNKVLALALSIILWTMVHIDTASTTQTTARMETRIIENVPIQQTGLDEDKYVLEKDADSVRLEVMGKSNDLTYLFSDNYKVTLDLSHVEPGTATVSLKYSLPRGVQLISIDPAEVHVHIEERSEKSFPVTVVTKGTPAAGYQAGTPVTEPSTVKVTLPASELASVAKVQGVVELDGLNESVSGKKVKLAAYDADGGEIKDAELDPSSVSVDVPVTLPFKSVPLSIGYTGSLPDSLVLSSVKPETDKITVYGQEKDLQAVTSYQATLDLGTVKSAGTTTVELELKPPEGVSEVAPKTIKVAVVASEVAERTISDIPVTVEGAASGLSAILTAPSSRTISLTLSGASSLLDGLRKDDIKAVADVSSLGAGDHDVPVKVTLPSFIELSGSGAPVVTVKVTSATYASPSPTPEGAPAVTVSPQPSAEPVTGSEDSVSAPGDNPEPSPQPSATASPENTNEGVGEASEQPAVQ
ncbi:CdaR family protein [Paenibacillus stellifer]|uniref:CdaR family protein n=1 Tax=Paenibacillus stellifer TaxID=169760 RepID=UPI00068B2514|nr:CdaR family protein [Paenibacillus stellifer]